MIRLNGKEVVFDTFPNKETKINENSITEAINSDNKLTFKYGDDSDLIKLMLVKRYLDDLSSVTSLRITYMPYSRMDRSEDGSAFTLKYVSEFINSLNFKYVEVIEPHSDVTTALLDKSKARFTNFDILPQVLEEVGFDKDKDVLFFPDAGAQKRYGGIKGYKQLVGFKHRDFKTGEIESLEVVGKVPDKDFKVVIVDDLSSYGGTFYFSALKLKELGATNINLIIGHAENSIFKGKLFSSGFIDKIYTTDSLISEQDNSENQQYQDKLKIFKLEELPNG